MQLKPELDQRSATEYIAGTHSGISAAYLGEMDKAIGHLEKPYEDYDL